MSFLTRETEVNHLSKLSGKTAKPSEPGIGSSKFTVAYSVHSEWEQQDRDWITHLLIKDDIVFSTYS